MSNNERDEEANISWREKVAIKFRDFKVYMWNPKTKQFLGRSGLSWLAILSFYFLSFAFLTGYFAICMSIFQTTLNPRAPTMQMMYNQIRNAPGMKFDPQLANDGTLVSTIIANKSYVQIENAINAKLQSYQGQSQRNICDGKNVTSDMSKACGFDTSTISSLCNQTTHYGYVQGQPCVLLRLNQIYGWDPNTDLIDQIPKCDGSADASNACLFSKVNDGLKTKFMRGYIPVSCEGQYDGDSEYLYNVTFDPPYGIPAYYYPYLNQPNYQSPLLFAKFKVQPGVLVMLWCRFWTKTNVQDLYDRQSSVLFEVLVDVPLADYTLTGV